MTAPSDAPCIVEDCEKPRGVEHRLCRMHRARRERYGSTDPTPYSQAPASERFWRYVTPGAPTERWPWRGAINTSGYGQLRCIGQGAVYAHRLSYEIHVGPVPDGLFILHSCDVRPCVNPAHLRPGTHAENMADMVARGRTSNRAKS